MKPRAFTLIELLVVIAIIALLMAILMPSLKLAKDQATRIHCVSNTKALLLGWLLYKDDWDGKLVPGHTGRRTDAEVGWVNQLQWVDEPPALNSNWILKKEAIARGALFNYVGREVQIYRCPADRRKESSSLPVAYGTFSVAGGANGESWTAYRRCTIYSEIKRPATTYIFVEEMDTRGLNQGSWQMDPDPVNPSWTDPVAMWHNRKSSMAFADGSAEMHTWESLDFITWNLRFMNEPGFAQFGHQSPADDRKDLDFMAKGFPYKAIR